MTQTQSAEEKERLKKQWTDLAIQQALASQWAEAVITNKNILNLFPHEPDAYNRLGKAFSELGQYAEARQAYSQTLKYSPKTPLQRRTWNGSHFYRKNLYRFILGLSALIRVSSSKRLVKQVRPN